jgi:hypothetical protein
MAPRSKRIQGHLVPSGYRELAAFLDRLESREHSAGVCNPYRLPGRTANLCAYLDALLSAKGRRMLLVGEAPGYRGALQTGIPFSSPRLLKQSSHAFWQGLRPALDLQGDGHENTATLAWQVLAGRRALPLFWNAFPFHPHHPGRAQSNRAPRARELDEGRCYLQQLAGLYHPHCIAGIGRKGTAAAFAAFPGQQVWSIRHPSYGGKQAFNEGMTALYQLRLRLNPAPA